MNSKDNLMPTNVSSIISNFSDLVKNFSNKETEWQIQKEEYEQRISELEGEVKAHENINIDLLKRIRMLEYALSQERSKNSNKGDNSNINIPQDNSLFNDLGPQNLIKEEDLKFLRETSNRHSMINVLQSIGIDENLANNLFTDFELNRTELEAMIKKNLDEKLAKTGKDNISQIVNNKGNIQNNTSNNNSEDNNEIGYKDKNKSPSFSFNECLELRSHFDEVRKLTYLPEMNSLVSVSEDCLIKVWSLNNLFSNSQYKVLEPYLTLRGHTGPLYCTEKGKEGSSIIYTAGNEGLIQIWNVPKQEDVQQYGPSETLFNLNVGFYQKSEEGEIIWDLKHHPSSDLLVSLSSDTSINFWKTTTVEDYVQAFTSENFNENWLISTKSKKANYLGNGEYAIPTRCDFLKTENNKMVIGFNDATVSIMDVETGAFTLHYNTMTQQGAKVNKVLSQPNCFALSNSLPLIYTGFEDSSIKIIDLRYKDGVVTNNTNAHTDAVTSLNLLNDIYLFSVSHDTIIKMWDIRKFNVPILTTVGSQKKWDEAMWDSLLIESTLLYCVACADCTIKLFKL